MNIFVCFTFRIFQIIVNKNLQILFIADYYFINLGSRKTNFRFCFVFFKISRSIFCQLGGNNFYQYPNLEIKNLKLLLKILLNFQYFIYYDNMTQILSRNIFLKNNLNHKILSRTNFDDSSKIYLNSNFNKFKIQNLGLTTFKKYNLFLKSKEKSLTKIKQENFSLLLIILFSILFSVCSFNKNRSFVDLKFFNYIIFKIQSNQCGNFTDIENPKFLISCMNLEKIENIFLKYTFKENIQINFESSNFSIFYIFSLINFCLVTFGTKKKCA